MSYGFYANEGQDNAVNRLPDFSFAGNLENPSDTTVKQMIQDLLGSNVDIGISDELTIDNFDFSADLNGKTGKLTAFSTDIGMSGGFGIFKHFDASLQSISVGVTYTGT